MFRFDFHISQKMKKEEFLMFFFSSVEGIKNTEPQMTRYKVVYCI